MSDGVETVSMDKLAFAVSYLIDVLEKLAAEKAAAVSKSKKKRRPTVRKVVKKPIPEDGTRKKKGTFYGHRKQKHKPQTIKRGNYVKMSSSFQRERKSNLKLNYLSFVDVVLQSARRYTIDHRWSEAASVMPGVHELITTYALVVWKVGSLILLNHPESCSEHIRSFANKIVHMCQCHRNDVVLDHVTYLMGCGDYVEAKRFIENVPLKGYRLQLSNSVLAYREGFRALVEYFAWMDKSSSTDDGQDLPGNQLADCDLEADLKVHFNRACDCFDAAVPCTGNMDIFIESYVQMLELVGDWKKADTVLQEYTKTNESHPSPFAFYYEFLKRRRRFDDNVSDDDESDVGRQTRTLEKLISRNPSDARVLDLFRLYDETEFTSRFNLLANTVDHAGWRDDVDVWNHLATMITQDHTDSENDYRKTLDTFVKDRASFWSPFHFDASDVRGPIQSNVELYTSKAIVAATIYGRKHPFVTAVKEGLIENEWFDDVDRLQTALKSIPSRYQKGASKKSSR